MSEEKVLAVIAGATITEKDLTDYMNSLPEENQGYKTNPRFRQHCLDQMINHRVFWKLGEELELEKTEEFKVIMEDAKKDVLARLAMGKALEGITVSDEEIETYYKENPEEFEDEGTVHAKHILVRDEEKCRELLAIIENGEKSFEDVAKESSECPSGQRGGDLGSFGKGQMVKEFEDAAFEAEIGAVVGPVQTQFGYHLIKVEGKEESTMETLDEVKDEIREELMRAKHSDAFSKKVAELREKYLEK